jgi:Fic family protein
MTADKEDLLTSAGIAKQLGVSDAKVKKAIKELAIEPSAKKGVCSYYSQDALAKVKAALK